MHRIPTLIIGGGISGASLACSLAEREQGAGVAVVDVDLFGKPGPGESGAGGVRRTMPHPLTAALAGSTHRYYRENAQRLDLKLGGWLTLHDKAVATTPRGAASIADADHQSRRSQLTAADVSAAFPFLRLDDFIGSATLDAGDGWLSSHRLRVHYLNRAQAAGVELMDSWMATAIEYDTPPYKVTLRRIAPRSARRALWGAAVPLGETLAVAVDRLVIAAGASSAKLAESNGLLLPLSVGVRRVALLRDAPEGLAAFPLVADEPAAARVRPHLYDRRPALLVTNRDPTASPTMVEPPAVDQAAYERDALPHLLRRFAGIEQCRFVAGWAGLEARSHDGLPMLGLATGRRDLYLCCGLGASSVPLSRGVGEALAIQILHNRWPVGLDLSPLTPKLR